MPGNRHLLKTLFGRMKTGDARAADAATLPGGTDATLVSLPEPPLPDAHPSALRGGVSSTSRGTSGTMFGQLASPFATTKEVVKKESASDAAATPFDVGGGKR